MTRPPTTLNELFNSAVECYRESEFMRFRSSQGWRSLSYGEAARRVRELALGLSALGINRGDRIAIWSENRPEWNIADLACLAVGAIDVPIYTTQSRPQVEYILADSGARAMFASSKFLAEALEVAARVNSIERVICFDEYDKSERDENVSTAAELIEIGRRTFGERPDLYEALWRGARPDDLATLLYTSGTTGEPKGVMLSHKNLTANVLNSFSWLGLSEHRDVVLTYLPFSHVFERGTWYLYVHCGAIIAYAESIDSVARDLVEVRPTVMTSVPRMFEKIYARIIERGSSTGFPRRQIFLRSLRVARKWAERQNRDQRIGFLLSLEHKIAGTLVYKKWREAVGGRIRVFISGGAPLAPEIAYIFYGAGITILQGYGLTETSPSISCNQASRNKIGTVGRVMEGVQVRIAEDGEILVKGDTVMVGYYNRPADNAEAFTDDGWFRTGDIGYVDEDEFLVITDRKKDLIKTSGGKYVAPQRLETMLKASRFVSQIVVVGNARKFPAALIVPNKELLRSYAELKGIDYDDEQKLLTDPRILDLFNRQVEKYTAGAARFERIKRISLLSNDLTIDSGELTPTLKPRRRIIEAKYANVIDKMYDDARDQAIAV